MICLTSDVRAGTATRARRGGHDLIRSLDSSLFNVLSARPTGCHPPLLRQRRGTPTILTSPRRIVIGVDTHLDTIHVAAITDTGQLLGDAEFRTNPTGYYVAITWPAASGRS